MPTTTETYQVGSLILNTLDFNIDTFTGRMTPPELVGEDIPNGFGYGEIPSARTIGPRFETWAMWVRGATNGILPADRRAKFNENRDTVIKAIYENSGFVRIRRKIKYPSGLIEQYADAQALSVSEVTFNGNDKASFNIEWKIAAGVWRHYTVVSEADLTFASTSITNIGTAAALPFEITFTGPLTNPRIRILGDWPSTLQYLGTLAGAATVTLDATDLSISNRALWPNVKWGGRFLLLIPPGTRTVAIDNGTPDTTPGSGTIHLEWEPAYL